MTQVTATWIGSISVVLWGTLALLTKLTGGQIPEFQLMAMTFTIAFLLMGIRWLRAGHTGIRFARQAGFAWAIGVVGLFGYHFAYFKAMTLAPAVEVSLLAYLWPLFIVLFSAMLPGESLRKQHLAGAVLALFGCWLLIGRNSSGFSADNLDGYLVALRLRVDLVVLLGIESIGENRAYRCGWLVLWRHRSAWLGLPSDVGADGLAGYLEPVGWGNRPGPWPGWCCLFYLGLRGEARQYSAAWYVVLQCAADLGGATDLRRVR